MDQFEIVPWRINSNINPPLLYQEGLFTGTTESLYYTPGTKITMLTTLALKFLKIINFKKKNCSPTPCH